MIVMLVRRIHLVLTLFLCILFMHATAPLTQAIELEKGDRVVFLGDSITQAGDRPGGYVAIIRDKAKQIAEDQQIEVIGAGISGNRVPDLQKRLERDVLLKQPDVVVIYIGINDVWHSIRGRGTPKEHFQAGLKDIIKQIKDVGASVVLCTPSVIGEKTDGSNDLDAMLDEYSAISRTVAKETGSELLDLRKRFLDHLKKHNNENLYKGVLTTDGVHLNAAGNQFVASAMLEALEMTENQTPEKLLRHVVLFQFKDDVSDEQIDEVVEAFKALPDKIDEIHDFECGTDVSVENKAAGFTHGFMVTFRTAADRDAYLPHPAHAEFGKLVRPRLKNVLVFDYYANE